MNIDNQTLAKYLKDPVLFQEKIAGLRLVSQTQRDILRSDAPRIAISAGRRWGKTCMLANYCLWWAMKYSGSEIVIVSASWEQIDIFMQQLKDIFNQIHPFLRKRIKVGAWRTRYVEIEKSKISAVSASRSSTAIRGHGADLLIRDEDAFILDSQMKSIRPLRIRMHKNAKDKKRKVKEIAASTPLGRNHFYNDFHSSSFESFQVPTWDNKFIPKEEIEQEKELMTDQEFRQEFGAEFLDDKYNAFPKEIIDNAVQQGLKMKESPEADVEYYAGIDLGKRKDASVIYIIHSEKGIVYVDYAQEVKNTQEGKFWQKMVSEAASTLRKFGVTTCFIDQTGLGDMPTEELSRTLEDKNIYTELKGVDFTTRVKNSRHGILSKLQIKFERGEVKIPMFQPLIKELNNVKFEATSQASSNQEIYGKFTHVGHDDHVIALALAVAALPRGNDIFYAGSNALGGTVNDSSDGHVEESLFRVTNQDNPLTGLT